MRRILPHISIALTLALLVVVYLDRRNPMMGFLSGAPFVTLVILAGIASIATALLCAVPKKKAKKPREKDEKVSYNT